MSKTPGQDGLVPWEKLPDARQIELRNEYGYYLDSLPPTCSLETKIERFRRWLQERGISYGG
jgi:hypothetical protein